MCFIGIEDCLVSIDLLRSLVVLVFVFDMEEDF